MVPRPIWIRDWLRDHAHTDEHLVQEGVFSAHAVRGFLPERTLKNRQLMELRRIAALAAVLLACDHLSRQLPPAKSIPSSKFYLPCILIVPGESHFEGPP